MDSVRGEVWKQGSTWFYEVSVGRRIIFADNTGAFAPVIRDCSFAVAVARWVVVAGHRFEFTWAELVEAAL